MNKTFSTLLMMLILFSCNNKPTIQEYFVENSEALDFTSLDLGSEIINTENLSLTSEDKIAIKSMERINVLAFKKNDTNTVKYLNEIKKVRIILKDSTSYKRLLKVGSGKEGASIYFVGDENNINEYIVFANKKESGFAILRVLGNDMNPTNMMKILNLLRKSKMDVDPFEPLNVIIN